MIKNVAILAGGDSGEYEVSINSAQVVQKHLDKNRYNPYLIHIKGKEWNYHAADNNVVPVDKNDFSILLGNEQVYFDIVFNAIHGTPGEDGKIQGYLEMLGIPHTSCSLTTSSLTFNKYFCLGFVRDLGLKTAWSLKVSEDSGFNIKEINETIGYPCFVKPNAGGSSVGTTKVTDESQMEKAVKLALKEDSAVLIEQYIPGTEITCGVFRSSGKLIALPLTEIVSHKEFFDYEAKYEGLADEITPARVTEETEEECKELSLILYRELECRGVVRFDYIFNKTGMYFLEVNTIPGLSEASIVPQQAAEAGFSLKQLFTYLIEDALES
jgi:D-alanine-D-alanine ligase